MKNTLSTLSKSLMYFHKSLLDFQSRVVKLQDKQDYNPYQLLQMSLQDPRFQWLRKFSQLIVHADIRSSEKIDPGTLEAPAIMAELKSILQDPEFLKQYQVAVSEDPSLETKKQYVQKALEQLQTHLH